MAKGQTTTSKGGGSNYSTGAGKAPAYAGKALSSGASQYSNQAKPGKQGYNLQGNDVSYKQMGSPGMSEGIGLDQEALDKLRELMGMRGQPAQSICDITSQQVPYSGLAGLAREGNEIRVQTQELPNGGIALMMAVPYDPTKDKDGKQLSGIVDSLCGAYAQTAAKYSTKSAGKTVGKSAGKASANYALPN